MNLVKDIDSLFPYLYAYFDMEHRFNIFLKIIYNIIILKEIDRGGGGGEDERIINIRGFKDISIGNLFY